MRVFIIDATHMGPELRGGLIGVVGSTSPTPEEKQECVDTVSRYVVDGWAIAADPHTPIGRLAAYTAEAACVPFVQLGWARLPWSTVSTIVSRSVLQRDPAELSTSLLPARMPESRDGGFGPKHASVENGGLSA